MSDVLGCELWVDADATCTMPQDTSAEARSGSQNLGRLFIRSVIFRPFVLLHLVS